MGPLDKSNAAWSRAASQAQDMLASKAALESAKADPFVTDYWKSDVKELKKSMDAEALTAQLGKMCEARKPSVSNLDYN
eukprot:7038164-Alexandrium_andersonii.AAC.1